ncbi:hypothetical protein HYR54_14900 [Candidatus Acetothermia bacterium]|nr:hypothetical protein [Candidatus Acetothermia bacterium]
MAAFVELEKAWNEYRQAKAAFEKHFWIYYHQKARVQELLLDYMEGSGGMGDPGIRQMLEELSAKTGIESMAEEMFLERKKKNADGWLHR